ncbi:hypothetical protein DCAR_0414466 [Daucus carota subsp. sativus]|uniref:Uncharacterized protein n=1 Tax=Daucus carota subsp. sativus TaxID=79200 RepID=A0A164ZXC1_DAUCS|nr:hypothetical protein DCAR_0414466 [Daucus carota subsp. sativus]
MSTLSSISNLCFGGDYCHCSDQSGYCGCCSDPLMAKVLLMSLKADRVGINLTAASHAFVMVCSMCWSRFQIFSAIAILILYFVQPRT